MQESAILVTATGNLIRNVEVVSTNFGKLAQFDDLVKFSSCLAVVPSCQATSTNIHQHPPIIASLEQLALKGLISILVILIIGGKIY